MKKEYPEEREQRIQALAERILAVLVVLVMIAGVLVSAKEIGLSGLLFPRAAAASDGSITVSAQVERDGSSVKLVGDSWSLVKLGSGDLPAGWNALSSSEKQKAANTLAEKYTKSGAFDATGKTGTDGTVVFSELGRGTYLLVRTGVATANKDYTCYPCVVPLPLADPETGASEWDVNIVPKHEYVGEPTTADPAKPTVPDPTATTKADDPTTTTTVPGQTTTTARGTTTTVRGTTTTTAKAGTTTVTRTNVVQRIASYVNTDSARALTIALVILGISAAALVIVVLARRKNRDEE